MSISATARKLMSDEERAKIVRQATEDTNKFLDSLPRKQYKDGWPEDKWEEVRIKRIVLYFSVNKLSFFFFKCKLLRFISVYNYFLMTFIKTGSRHLKSFISLSCCCYIATFK